MSCQLSQSTKVEADKEGFVSCQPSEETYQKPPQPWRCGNNFQYPLPEPEGDSWNSLLKPLLESDTMQCNAWVDEVQNLLIFAGLFSAVVTSFAVATYPNLQEDPVVALLAQIAANSANNNGSTTIQPPIFIPSPSAVRLNIFLFLSLILSLSTVLIGIVALQWIREHRRHSNTLSTQNMFASLHMRTEALHEWHVPQIFASLPVLLQCALVFFFAGITELLVDASTIVLIPVAAVMSMTIIFLISTTILPTVQAVTLSHLHDKVPAPCPYKSPQANAFRRLVTSSETLFRATSVSFAVPWWTVLHLMLLPRTFFTFAYYSMSEGHLFSPIREAFSWVRRFYYSTLYRVPPALRSFCPSNRGEWHGFDYMESKILEYWRVPSWNEFDLAWMSVRDNYFQSICPPESWLFRHREERREYAALYDATQGLCEELARDNFNTHVQAEPAMITAYHCVLKLCAPSFNHFNRANLVVAYFERNQYLATLLGFDEITPLGPFSDKLRRTHLAMCKEEASFMFLSFIQEYLRSINERSPLLTLHYAEIYLRLLGELYSKPYEINDDVGDVGSIETPFNGAELYVMKIFDSPDQPFTHQWALSITAFFSVLGDRQIPQTTLANSFHAHPFFRSYSANFWRQVKHEIHKRTIQEITTNETINTLSVVRELLAKCFTEIDEAEANHARDKFIFESAAVHLWNYTSREIPPDLTISEAVDSALDGLHAAQKRLLGFLGRRSSPEQGLSAIAGSGWSAEGWWVELFSDTVSDENVPVVASSHSGGELTIEFSDS